MADVTLRPYEPAADEGRFSTGLTRHFRATWYGEQILSLLTVAQRKAALDSIEDASDRAAAAAYVRANYPIVAARRRAALARQEREIS